MKKAIPLFLAGLVIGSIVTFTAPASAGSTSLIDKVYGKVKTILGTVQDIESKVNTVKNTTNDTEDLVDYENRLTEDMYDNAYYQSLLLNNIATNSYFACLYSGIDPDSCFSPLDDLIDVDALLTFEITPMSVEGAQVQSVDKKSRAENADRSVQRYQELLNNQ